MAIPFLSCNNKITDSVLFPESWRTVFVIVAIEQDDRRFSMESKYWALEWLPTLWGQWWISWRCSKKETSKCVSGINGGFPSSPFLKTQRYK